MAPRQWGATSKTRASAGPLKKRNVVQTFELLQEQKQALINVFLIGKFLFDLVKDFFDGHGSIALLPHRRAELIEMSGEDVVPSHDLHKFLANGTGELWDLDLHKAVLTRRPLKTKSLRLVLEEFLNGR